MPKKTGRRSPGRPKVPVARELLIAKARSAFAEAGYAGASMAQIAEQVGIRKSTLFHHVTSKEQLYVEVMEGLLADLESLVLKSMAPETFPDRLDRLGELVSRYLGENPDAARLIVREFAGHGDLVPEGLQVAVGGTIRAIAMFLRLGMDEGKITVRDPDHLAMSLIGMHLMYWAAPGVSRLIAGDDIFTECAVQARIDEAQIHARQLCGVEESSDA